MRRAGAEALFLLSAPLNVHTLKSLEEGTRGLLDLRRSVGSPPQSTMRVYTRTLAEVGVLERRRDGGFPATVEYGITPAGEALLRVGAALEIWLGESPDGEIELGSTAAKSATRALAEGWSTNIIRALAAKPHALTELSRLIPQTSYPSLERRLGAMRLMGQLEPHPGNGRGTPYRVTSWLRRAAVPLTAAAAWERQFAPASTTPIGRLDVEAAFLLAIPLIELPDSVSGSCRLVVEVHGGAKPIFAGVLLCVEDGRVTTCSSRLEGHADAIVSGRPATWFRALTDAGADQLEVAGEVALGRTLVEALRGTAAAGMPTASARR